MHVKNMEAIAEFGQCQCGVWYGVFHADRNTYLDKGGTTKERLMGGRGEGGLDNAFEQFESYGGHLGLCRQFSILDGVYHAGKDLS